MQHDTISLENLSINITSSFHYTITLTKKSQAKRVDNTPTALSNHNLPLILFRLLNGRLFSEKSPKDKKTSYMQTKKSEHRSLANEMAPRHKTEYLSIERVKHTEYSLHVKQLICLCHKHMYEGNIMKRILCA